MPTFLQVIWDTVVLRPYVFVFVAMFLAAAWLSQGKWRALGFLVIGYLVAFTSEWVSIRWGFPYGHYHYLYDNMGEYELMVGGRPPPGSPPGTAAGVPFFDSLSYTFLAYVSWSFALFFTQPLYGRGADLQLADTPESRRAWPQWLLATFFMGLLDVVVDPVAHLGRRWFLGEIYGYAHPGEYFDIPLTNFLGWWLVAGTIFFLYSRLDGWLARDPLLNTAGCRYVPGRALLGPALYYCVLLFNLVVTFWLGEVHLGLAGVFIYLPITLLMALRIMRGGRASFAQVGRHRTAYPGLGRLAQGSRSLYNASHVPTSGDVR